MDFNQKLQKDIEKEIEEILNAIIKQNKIKIREIKSEIYGLYVKIITESMVEQFNLYYGNNYSKNSLINSLSFHSGSGLLPNFNYDINKFKFYKKINNKRKFNLNSKKISNINETRRINSNPRFFDVMDEISMEEEIEDEDEVLNDIMIEFLPSNQKGIQDTYIPIKEAYKKASEKSIDAFNKQYVTQIKPRILKKYGIKLG